MRTSIIALQHRRASISQHPGLLLQRYVCQNTTGDADNSKEKRAVLEAAIKAAADRELRELYRSGFTRWQNSLPELTVAQVLQSDGRLIVGLGSENVLETGIRLHHTYGMPILPGSALKGLASHYCDQAWGKDNPKFKKPTLDEHEAYRGYLVGNGSKPPKDNYHRLLFGTNDDSGCIIFHDAWFVPDSEKEPLKLDVMTPHHKNWLDGTEPPSDYDSPVPVPFLSVMGQFCIAISWCGPVKESALNWRNLAMDCLRDALFQWGIGGKTSSGYGRFDEAKWKTDEEVRIREEEKRRVETEKEAALLAMSPIERSIQDFLLKHPDKQAKEYMKLLKELEKPDGRFSNPQDRKIVAAKIKAAMQDAKEWKDKEPHRKRKIFIEQILGE